ncbi:MAG: ABC transporter permease [Firmicutes bacterium]|nr:ABC transporter permease [Bacillota bacterium]
MKATDLIRTCLNNLFRHKGRTILTIMGVVVGCCSVVLMISFGVAMKISMQAMLNEMGDLSVVEVRPKGNKKLYDSDIKQIKGIANVAGVMSEFTTTDLQISVRTADGRYLNTWPNVTGYYADDMKEFGYKVYKGELINKAKKNSVNLGRYSVYDYADTMRPEGYNTVDLYSMYNDDGTVSEEPEPYFDPMETKLVLTISDGDSKTRKKEFDLEVAGILEEDYSKGYMLSYGTILDTTALNEMIAEFRQEFGLSSTGRINYSLIRVKANDIANVPDVDSALKSMGYETSSMESFRKSIEKDANQKQLMFAGLGVISLFVAALGIMNTMIMAISERTREIGVMKALGCFVGDIRKMFLLEAAFIGLIGGIVGSVGSVLLSYVINYVALKSTLEGMGWEEIKNVLLTSTDRISVVPWQLAIGAVVFSVFVGIASGYYPANRAATKISALEAIKTE